MIEIRHKITGIVLRNISADSLSRADLYGADLSGANLHGVDLRGANLRGADLREANLHGADLRGANLRGANLRGANLRGADLYGADLSGADLYGSDLRKANLRGANLHSLGFDQRGYHFLLYFEPEPIIRAGCREFTIEQAEEHWQHAHPDSPILRAEILGKIALAEAIIAARNEVNHDSNN